MGLTVDWIKHWEQQTAFKVKKALLGSPRQSFSAAHDKMDCGIASAVFPIN